MIYSQEVLVITIWILYEYQVPIVINTCLRSYRSCGKRNVECTYKRVSGNYKHEYFINVKTSYRRH